MTTQTKSLYDRLGGLDMINALTESWVARVGGDDRANGKLIRTDIPRLMKELDELNVPGAEQAELAGLLMPMRDDIVEVESPTTGTPLPDSYQAAPPLT